MSDDLLRSSLLSLLSSLGNHADRLLLGGGYGLYLKQLHLPRTGQRTLIAANLWPVPRATQDLDLLLSVELVGDPHGMQAVRSALDQLGYQVIKGSEYLQFFRQCPGGAVVKIDLLTAQQDVVARSGSVEADDRRARPKARPRPKLHAHPTDGALALDEPPLIVPLAGRSEDGKTMAVNARIPHPFAYLLMKLTAYRDRRRDMDKQFGRHHALDIFRIVAMLTEDDDRRIHELAGQYASDHQVESCRQVIASDFSSPKAPGILAMRGHPLWQNDEQLDQFIEWITGTLAK